MKDKDSAAEEFPMRVGVSAPEECTSLIVALEKQTAAISAYTRAVVELTESLRDLLEEEADEDAGPPTYLNGDAIKR